MAKSKTSSKKLASIIIEAIQEKKGQDIISLNLRDIENAVTDYFVICHGTSRPQVEAIAESVMDAVDKKTGDDPWHKEGTENAEWILLDYVDVVVHIFRDNTRGFYQLEKLWADAKVEHAASEE